MAGKIKIGNRIASLPDKPQGVVIKRDDNVWFVSQSQVGIPTAGFPIPVLGGTPWIIPSVSPGQRIYLLNAGFHTRVEKISGEEFNTTQYSRAIVGSVSSINTNNVSQNIWIDGNNPFLQLTKPIPINYDTTGWLFIVRVFLNQLPAPYVYAATDTVEVESWASFLIK